jgi:hypothetical protein
MASFAMAGSVSIRLRGTRHARLTAVMRMKTARKISAEAAAVHLAAAVLLIFLLYLFAATPT